MNTMKMFVTLFLCLTLCLFLPFISCNSSDDDDDNDNGNQGPIANAGPDQTVLVGDLVTLNGGLSSDPTGSPLTFQWSFLFLPSGSQAALAGADTESPGFTADVVGNYSISLTVTNTQGNSGTDEVLITAISDDPDEVHWESRGIGGGGALFSPAISPHDSSRLFCATDMSSVFESKTFGRQWQTVHFSEIQGGISSEVRFTSDPMVLYSINLANDIRVPMSSSDGGKTWAPLPGDPTDSEAFYLFADLNVTNRLIVSSWSTIYWSEDGGTSFRQIYSPSNPDDGVHIAGVFWNGGQIFIGTEYGLVISENNGQSFQSVSISGIPSGNEIATFTGGIENGFIRLFAVAIDEADIYGGVTGSEIWGFEGVYRLNWGNNQWQRVSGTFPESVHPFFVAMSPSDIDTIYVAGGDIDTYYPIVYKSDDGGTTWSDIFRTENNENIYTGWCGNGGDEDWWYPEYALGFAVCPTDTNRAVITDLGFIHVTSDGGQTWRQAYVDPETENPAGSTTPVGKAYRGIGLENTSSWWLHWPDSETVIAGFSDFSGIRSTDGGARWVAGSAIGLPHNSTYHFVETPNGTMYGATSSVHDLYQSTYLEDDYIDYGEGSIIMSSDKGASWSMLHDFGHPVFWLSLDPNNGNVLYASVVHSSEGGIYKTANLTSGQSATWERLTAPPRTEGHPHSIAVLNDGTLVCTYSGRRDSSGAFTESSGVFVSTNGGNTWEDRSISNMYRWSKDLVIDPHDSSQNTWYVCVFSHWGSFPSEVGGVYRTKDRGLNWVRLSDLYRVHSVTVHPQSADTLYLTTETQGLWKTSNGSSDTPQWQQIAEYPFFQPTRLFFNPWNINEIWACSFGGGLRLLSSE